MKKRIMAIVLLGVMLLGGCQPVPKNVKQDIADLKEAKEELQKIREERNFQTITELSKLDGQIRKEERGLVHVDAEIHVPNAEEVYKLELHNNTAFWDNRYQILQNIGGEELTDTSQILYGSDEAGNYYNGNANEFYLQKLDEGGRLDGKLGEYAGRHIEVDNIGNLTIGDGSVPSSSDMGNDVYVEKRYTGQEIKECSDSFTLMDGSVVSMSEVVERFHEHTAYVKEYLPQTDIVLSDICVMQSEDNRCSLDIFGEVRYRGVPLSKIGVEAGDVIDFEYEFNAAACCYLDNVTSTEASRVVKIDGSYGDIAELETYKEVLDLDSALDILSSKVAMDKVTNISKVSLEYFVSYPKNQSRAVDRNITYEGRPVWSFFEPITGQSEEQTHFLCGLAQMYMLGNIYYVDAVTGEFFAYEEVLL